MASGIVFDIQRFSLNDGPGIRTTVFLKGCFLNCLWCHNPESISSKPQLFFVAEKCAHCRTCGRACSRKVHTFPGGRHRIEFKKCRACGACVAACPNQALRIAGTRMTVAAVMKEVLRDRAYYRKSGGGMTISGGEPMYQFGFTIALLKQARASKVRTALETCGLVSPEKLREAARYTDLFLFDYKASDRAEHKRMTGADNRLIHQNLAALLKAGKSVILRCPLVPGVNDDDGHLRAIATLARDYPKLAGIEIMPFHDLGAVKSRAIGRPVGLPDLPTASEEQKQLWLAVLSSLGCSRVKLG